MAKLEEIPVLCNTCSHFAPSKGASKAFEELCLYLGTQNYRNACKRYDPNVSLVSEAWGTDFIAQIGRTTKDMTPEQIMVLSQTLARASDMKRKTGLAFGQPVFFSLNRLNLLEDYRRGYVGGWDNKHKWIIIIASLHDEDRADSCFNLKRDSVLTRGEFRELISKGILQDHVHKEPTQHFSPKIPGKYLDYLKEQTLSETVKRILDDVIPFSGEDVVKKPKKKGSKRTAIKDTVEVVNQLGAVG